MTLALHVDTELWRAHLTSYVSAHPAIVPVVKGNGYGFGVDVLATTAAELGVGALALGTYDEVPMAEAGFGGDLLVLRPWRPWVDAAALHDPRVLHTVSRLEDLRALAATGERPRVVVEVLTSMRRHGVDPDELEAVAPLLDAVAFEGWALHLPLAGDPFDECVRLSRRALEVCAAPVWVSHLSPARAGALELPNVRLRVGTALWLGARSALRARARVLDVHAVRRGDPYGYRQRHAPGAGYVLVVAGGTSHGIGLEAPTAATTFRQRGVALARGGLSAAGRALSPYTVAGKQRWFAEPPHMQCSMLWLPSSVPPPEVGDEVDVDVRLTTTSFDALMWE